MNNAQRLAMELDRHLTRETSIIVFGSAAFLLNPEVHELLQGRQTNDIDIIIPAQLEMAIDADAVFWDAIEATNREMEPRGLYISHIFPEEEVVLTPEWQDHLRPLAVSGLQHLRISCPRTLDMVLSKMGRGDATDIADIHRMISMERRVYGHAITAEEISAAAARVNIPEAYQDIFPGARDRIIGSVREEQSKAHRHRPSSEGTRGRRIGL